MRNAKNLIGVKFGRLTVIERCESYFDGHAMWRCVCECGNEKAVQSNNLQKKNGGTRSCGCINRERMSKMSKNNAPWNTGISYSNFDRVFKNKKWWSKVSKRKHGDKCQKCGWDKASCDVHHIIPISLGGLNTVENAMVLCPNCHRTSHESS